jgi:hypothetical protein
MTSTALAPINVETVVAWARIGWKFIPIREHAGKPVFPDNWTDANRSPVTSNEATLRAWCADPTVKRLAIPTGALSGIDALDLDEKGGKSGSATLAKLGHTIPEGALRWRTRSGGEHVIFLHTGPTPTDAGKLGEGIDRRGDGGCVFFWPAHGYAVTPGAIAPPPAWFTAASKPASDKPVPDRVGLTDEQLQQLIVRIPPETVNGYQEWVQLGMALFHETDGSDYGKALFNWVSQQPAARQGIDEHGKPCDKYDARSIDRKWRSFGGDANPITIRSYLKHAPDIAGKAGALQAAFDMLAKTMANPAPLPPGVSATQTPAGNATGTPTWQPPAFVPPGNVAFERFAKALQSGDQINVDIASERAEIIEGIIAEGTQGTIYGAPGTAKTFASITMGFCIAEGIRFLGQEVAQGDIVYVAAEAARTVRDRMRAYRKETGRALARFHLLPQRVNMMDPAEIDGLVMLIEHKAKEIGRPIKLAIVDTVARSMPGGNENSSEDMGRLVAAADQINERTGAAVLFVHHAGKDESRGARGSNALLGAVDTELAMSKDESGKVYTLLVSKQRDLPTERMSWAFKLKPVHLGTNQWGKPTGSAVVVPLGEQEARQERAASKPITGTNQKLVMQAVRDAIQARNRPFVTPDEVRAEFNRRTGHMTTKQQSDAFRPAISALVASRYVDQITNPVGETWIAFRFADTSHEAALASLAASQTPIESAPDSGTSGNPE